VIGLLAAGCASPKAAGVVESANLVWPDPPQTPRIRYIRSIRHMADVKGEPSWLGRIAQGVFGSSREKLLKPYGVATDGLGGVYVADTGKGIVYKFDLESAKVLRYSEFETCDPSARSGGSFFSRLFSKTPRMRLMSPIGVAADGRGGLYVSDSILNKVFVFDEKGRCIRAFGEDETLLRPSGIAVNRRLDRLYVADTAGHRVVAYALDGEKLFEFGQRGEKPGDFNYPTNIFVGADDRVYVTDSLNFRIMIFTSEGELLSYFGSLGRVSGSFNKPKGVAVDSEGHIYVVDAMFDNVQIFDAEGRLLLAFGGSGTGEGEFWLPSGIFIDDRDRIYVSDSYNTRIQIFQYLGRQAGDDSQ
jgi:DNA-binding beta-propeller fold protein YncE